MRLIFCVVPRSSASSGRISGEPDDAAGADDAAGVVLQEPFMFRGTIWDNLVYGLPTSDAGQAIQRLATLVDQSASAQEVERAAEEARTAVRRAAGLR